VRHEIWTRSLPRAFLNIPAGLSCQSRRVRIIESQSKRQSARC
jgi:hypothetical protein